MYETWLPISLLKEIENILGTTLWLVGGAVRGYLTNQPTNDLDLVTSLLPEIVAQKLKNAGYNVNTNGIEHGRIAIICRQSENWYNLDITTMRSDQKTDGRHAQVIFTNNLYVDAQRRDFTVNAIYLSLNGEIADPVGGVADLQNYILRFIGKAEKRIPEDYLRIFRFFRFLASNTKWQYQHDELATIYQLHQGISVLSKERVTQEINKILLAPNASLAIKLALPILRTWFTPQLITDTVNVTQDDIILSWALLFKKPIALECLQNKIAFNKQQLKVFTRLISHRLTDVASHYRYQHQYGYQEYKRLYRYLQHIEHSKLPLIPPLPALPVSTQDLIKCGFTGKKLGEALHRVTEQWLSSYCKSTREDLLSYLASTKQ